MGFLLLFEDSKEEVTSLDLGSFYDPEAIPDPEVNNPPEVAVKLEDDPDPPEDPFDYPNGYIEPLPVKSDPDLDDNMNKQRTDNNECLDIPFAGDSILLDHAASNPYLYSLTNNDTLTVYSDI